MTVTKKSNLNERVFLKLKEMIINGELKPGQKITELHLSKQLNASRTPVRDALRRLELENLVNLLPSQGAEVTKLSKRTIIDLYECRAVLEGLAIRQATEKISQDDLILFEESTLLAENYFLQGNIEKVVEKNTFFHDQLMNLSNNSPLIQMMNGIRTQIIRYRKITGDVGFRESFLTEHKDILKALLARDAEQAESLMRAHILKDLKYFLEKLEHLLND
ncbi:hypothetical protein CHH78_13230 [Shouchella clausii]|uniref:HTH gntR-type domain-containing protein n=1 Tax=Shouchella clausii TaxID=79880 RepID=A0A268S0K0_SHOCL|nr:GntR family transcriptional regulator [Shouchella clausii]PAD42441.1 hypothetical protein CHH54_12135 [Bacillus sp. 7520-S]MBU8597390.1 GntR family transcriptional regulator [Shouchella clausii]MCY1105053.1 GntR family transcriptional regulator [Shouchella clausii]PAD08445.1 hypothetical protein CHH76_14465 [Shouchella clausii]PAE81105.1 hypothetical protein CHH78_13230 [Shouchella clausii]